MRAPLLVDILIYDTIDVLSVVIITFEVGALIILDFTKSPLTLVVTPILPRGGGLCTESEENEEAPFSRRRTLL
jgi:hypothetical protein